MAIRRYSAFFLANRRLSTAAAFHSPPAPNPADPSAPPHNPIFLLKSSLRAESDPEKILASFQSSTHLPGFYDNRLLYQISVEKLARSHRPDLVEALLESQMTDPAAPKSEGFFIRIMSLYTEASMPDHASRTFEQIPSRTEHSVCALLTAYLKQHRYDRVRELFDHVPAEYGIAAGVATHNILLSALCNSGEVQLARKMLDEMLDNKGLKPNIISYNTVLSAYLKNEDEAGFEDILQEISSKGVPHNIVTYNLRISNLCQRKESLKAEELLDASVSNGIQPNLSTFNTIIKGFCKEGDLNSAVRVLKRMKKMKRPNWKKVVSPSPDTYISLLRALVGKGDFASAVPICHECLDREFPPPFDVMKALVHELVKDSKPEGAKALVDKMKKVVSGGALDAWTKLEAQLPL